MEIITRRKTLLSLDAGFSHTGYVIIYQGDVISYGVIETKKATKKTVRVADDRAERAASIAIQLSDIIEAHNCCGVIGELPSGGAQNARALAEMTGATCTIAATAALMNIPVEWCTPQEVKKAVTGRIAVTKREIMLSVIESIGGLVITKAVKCRKTKNFPDGYRTDYKYKIKDEVLAEGKFEHIADAYGAYLALKNNNLVRLFG